MKMVPSDDLHAMLAELDLSIDYHEQWSRALYRTLSCRLKADDNHLRHDAHRLCHFGQWFYSQAPQHLLEQPAFVAIEDDHRHMHALATELLTILAAGANITPDKYDEFAGAMDRMRLQLLSIRHEIENFLYSRDPLTGANTRIGMFIKLREQQELVKRHVQSCSIAMLDLDHFKIVNDTYGHQAGDSVLMDTVRYLVEHLRPYDSIFRYGGEEFIISLPGMDLTQAHALVERLREGLASERVVIDEKLSIARSASFGITLLDPDMPVEQSIGRADKAMYAAKSAGRNCTRIWDISM
jgi:diguanylate cyclase (GGDEF)-like protein